MRDNVRSSLRDNALLLRAVGRASPLDGRRGVVRLAAQTMDALGLRPWAPVALTARRLTGALVAMAPPHTDARTVVCDDLTLRNLGLDRGGGDVTLRPAPERAASRIVLAGPPQMLQHVPPEVLRLALLGKVLCRGDQVSLVAQDFALPPGSDQRAVDAARRHLKTAGGMDWTGMLLLVTAAEPAELTIVTMGTVVGWADGAATGGSGTPVTLPPVSSGSSSSSRDTVPGDVPGLEEQARELHEWLDLNLHGTEILAKLGVEPQDGVLVSGPAGSGKASLVERAAAAVGAPLHRLWGPRLAGLDASSAAAELQRVADAALQAPPAVVLVEDIDAVAPSGESPAPLLSTVVETVERLVRGRRVAVVGTTSRPAAASPLLRRPGLLEREVVVPLPTSEQRHTMLTALTAPMPLAPDVDLDDVAGRTPGFVLADLVALCREAGVRAAHRERTAGTATPSVTRADVDAALEVVRPTAMEGQSLEVPGLTLDDVGDMAAVKQALVEAVIWPLTYPDTFRRLGVAPPRGVLLYGPPGCGKTFLVRALAGTGRANVLSVKGAELMSKWVGESERGVRDLFRRAREAAPALVFLDEVDALAPPRGRGTDSGVGDRVVAALLTELDGLESLRDVSVVAATNRPDLVDPAVLRPGRLERLVYVPPPDAEARAAILRAAAKHTPLAADVDLAAIAADCEGYSAADCAALVREAALTAMRESLETSVVTAAHLAAARRAVPPSLRAEQVAELARFAEERAARA